MDFKWINKVRKVGATMIMDKLNMMINYSDESSTKYIISNFIKNNIIKIPNMTITQLASACYTSKGQISKYIQSLGYETMQDFKLDCIEYIESIPRTDKTIYSIEKISKINMSRLPKILFIHCSTL
ncbi:MurR/RpiR family transcriptional regulator [Enterococcus cecorum]|nr:MurR/RpiR family transcriptional regulator [Enterococcus cecorum]